MQWVRWSVGRVLIGLLTILGITLVVFLISRAVPGDVATTLLGPFATEEQRAAVTERLGLDQPVYTQYWLWLVSMLQGDFGTSVASGMPVLDELALRLPVTALIAGMSLVLALVIGVPLGIAQALHVRKARGVTGRVLSGFAISFPEFALGSIIIFIFSTLQLGVSVGAFTSVTDNFWGGVASSIIPAAILSVFTIGATARTTRDAVLDVLVEPFIQASVARGDSPGSIVRHHILRNASIPVVTLTATLTAYLLGGAVIIEAMFNVPGLGSYLLTALDRRDYAVIQAGVTLAAIVFVAMSVLVELLSSLIDPRVSTVGGRR